VPTVALSSNLADGIYIIAIVGMSVLLARPVYAVYTASQERGAVAVSSGVAEMIDSMSPGTSMVVRLESYPSVGLSVVLSGTTVTARMGEASSSAHVRWGVQAATLSPGEAYNFTLAGGEVLVGVAPDG